MKQEITTVVIPSLSRDYVFFHTSDAHIRYFPGNPDGERTLEEAQSYWKVPIELPPVHALKEVLRSAEAERADGVFLCGDLIQTYIPEAVAELKTHLDGAAVDLMYVCGNHERFFAKKLVPAEACYPSFAPLMSGNPEYWVRDFGEFRVVGIDNSSMEISEAQLSFLESQSAAGKPILLLMHAPMITESIVEPVRKRWGENANGYFLIGKEEDSPLTRRFYSFVRSPESRVAAIFAGHIHISHAGEFAPGRMQYTSAAAPIGVYRKIVLTGGR